MTTPAAETLPPLAQALCTAINAALALDEEAADILAPLEDAQLAVRVNGVAEVAVTFVAGRVRAQPSQAERKPDLVISGSAGEFLRLGTELARQLPEGGGTPELPPGLRFEGDLGIAQRLIRALARLRPDFEAPLTGVFGDVAGHQLARALSGGARAAAGGARQFADDVAEYLREEAEITVGRHELEQFSDGVDEARDAVARLEQRLRRLEARPPSHVPRSGDA